MPIEQAQAIHQSRLDGLRPELAAGLQGRNQLTLEIGCGHGHFLTAYAQAHPDELCLGIDVLAERLERAGRKSRRLGLNNLFWAHAEADLLLEALPSEVRFTRNLFVLFPDPWPKRRHWKNRLIQPGFLSRLAARTEPGTRLCFRTDYAPYFSQAVDLLGSHLAWRIVPRDPWPFEEPTVFQSRATVYQSLIAHRR